MGRKAGLSSASKFEQLLEVRHWMDSSIIVDPEFDDDANDDELTGVGLDHLHQGNGFEHQQAA